MDLKKIASNIKRYRKEKGWSQELVARKADVPFTTFTKIENGTTKNPSIESLVKIAKALSISVDILLEDKKKNGNA